MNPTGPAGTLWLYGFDKKLKLVIETTNHLEEMGRIRAGVNSMVWIDPGTVKFYEISDPTLRRMSANRAIQYCGPEFQQTRVF
jgi:hypothetical protein